MDNAPTPLDDPLLLLDNPLKEVEDNGGGEPVNVALMEFFSCDLFTC
jgi:hypothetical protein